MVTLVLGNGFDKCLGWKTGYSDFLNSSFFPKNNKWKKSGMYNAIVNDAIAKEDSWGGIEESLERYAMLPETAHTFEEDLEFYNCLCFSFRLYLGSEVLREGEGANLEYRISARDSCSVDFIMEPLFFDSAINNVISFNYTDFGRIAKGVIKEYDGTDTNVRRIQRIIDSIDFRYLHRREDGRMVLGISSDAVLQDYRYDYYKKSHIAIPVSFYDILLDSQTLIFWGFSFSRCDQPYFNDFFRHISKPEEGKNKRTIFLVDYDDASHKKCLSRIETMLGGDLSSLCCKHEVIEVNTNRGVSSREFANMLLYLRAKISPF